MINDNGTLIINNSTNSETYAQLIKDYRKTNFPIYTDNARNKCEIY